MIKTAYKVIIIGCGPAGIACALSLLDYGINDVLLIDKSKFPRYKCCAGYITNKTRIAYEKYGLDFQKCHYSLIRDFNILYKNKWYQTIENKFLYTNKKIDRVELDYNFYKLAKKKKLTILENTTIRKHDLEKNIITLSDKNKINYEYLIFADGTFGYGSKYQKNQKKNIAMQLITKTNIEDKIDIHFGVTKKGYGWISTYRGITNVGLTDVYNPKINYQLEFKKFLKSQNIDANIKELTGAFTPIGIRKPIINNNIYYVGDALGACDPLTLSGLRYGLKSGEKCAEAIAKNNQSIFKRFALNLKIKFILMQIMQRLFYFRPILSAVFNIGCRFFGKLISLVFNNFFVNKK